MRLTIKDIARLAGTSPTAVSFVLNGKDEKRVRPETREAILAVVRKHGYRRSAAARALKLQRSFRVGVAVTGALGEHPLIGATSLHEIVNTVSHLLHRAGYGVAILQVDLARPQADVARQFQREDVDGFLFVDFPAAFLDRILFSLQEHGSPAVAMGARFDDDPGYAWAMIDRAGSYETGTRYLLEQGCRRLVMLDTDVNGHFTPAKRQGYERALAAAGVEPLPLFASAAKTARAAHEATGELLAAVPDVDAVMLTDNLFAPVVQLALGDTPCRLLGFGDASFANLCDPALTFLRLPVAELAGACVEHLLAWIDTPEESQPLQQLLPCELVVRAT